MPRAFRMKDEIQQAYPSAHVNLVPKPGGYFDVIVEGTTVFSKTEHIGTVTERFPEVGEVVALMQKAGF